jgi:hypothetical protein
MQAELILCVDILAFEFKIQEELALRAAKTRLDVELEDPFCVLANFLFCPCDEFDCYSLSISERIACILSKDQVLPVDSMLPEFLRNDIEFDIIQRSQPVILLVQEDASFYLLCTHWDMLPSAIDKGLQRHLCKCCFLESWYLGVGAIAGDCSEPLYLGDPELLYFECLERLLAHDPGEEVATLTAALALPCLALLDVKTVEPSDVVEMEAMEVGMLCHELVEDKEFVTMRVLGAMMQQMLDLQQQASSLLHDSSHCRRI